MNNKEHKVHRAGLGRVGKRVLVLGTILMLLAACATIQAAAPGVESVSTTPEAVAAQLFLALVTAPSAPPSPLYLPLISAQMPLSTRLGFGATSGSIERYPEIASLRAGWYLDWNARVNPQRPNGMEYAQMIRVHQNITCPLGSINAHNRVLCPYVVPYSYSFWPNAGTIQQAAEANRGALWLLGNEMDRRDWLGGGRQDEMLPEVYADAYHELYTLIRSVDPTAQIAIGGVIQATPLRLQYLTRIWDSYKSKYGGDMPVDVWNVHAFVLREELNGYGADVPPGIDIPIGLYTENDCSHMAQQPFDEQIRAMRQWMKDRGQQNKSLIVTEYGVLYNSDNHEFNGKPPCTDPAVDPSSENAVQTYMLWTFDYFLNTRDTDIGYPADDYRLVQRWNWFSLDHLHVDENGNVIHGLNQYASLFNGTTGSITNSGQKFREYSLNNLSQLSRKVP